jgi:hypothetical protein
MSRRGAPLGGSTRSVVREIDQELSRLDRWQRAATTERELLLSARAALAEHAGGPPRGRRVSQHDIAAYLTERPGSRPTQIAAALHARATNVSTHLHRGRRTRYERREDGWYLRQHAAGDQS